MSVTGGPLRQLPQAATDHYLSRLVQAVRFLANAITRRDRVEAYLTANTRYRAR